MKQQILKDIKRVEIIETHISEIPKQIQLFKNLKCLNLQRNNLNSHSLNTKFFKDLLCSLREFDISDNYVEELPNFFFKSGINLTKLNVSKNYLTDISDEVKHLTFLKYLHLSSNYLRKFPRGVLLLQDLQELDFDWLFYLDSEFKNPIQGKNLIQKFQKKLKEIDEEDDISFDKFSQTLGEKRYFGRHRGVFESVKRESLTILKSFLQTKKDGGDILNGDQLTPFEYAIINGKKRAAKILIDLNFFKISSKKI